MCPSRRGVQCIIARADVTADEEAGVARPDGIPLALCHVYDDEEGSELRWLSRRANFSAESADCASPFIHGAGKLEILGMFPPRTEAPTADKLTFCYAPHVDMATVIEVEVRSPLFPGTRAIPFLLPKYFSIKSAACYVELRDL